MQIQVDRGSPADGIGNQASEDDMAIDVAGNGFKVLARLAARQNAVTMTDQATGKTSGRRIRGSLVMETG